MEFNLTTFFLEILNFAVLIWVLKRLLFQPVKKIISERQEDIRMNIEAANDLKKDALELRGQLEQRTALWNEEKKLREQHLDEEMNLLRAEKEYGLREEIQNERVKAKAIAKKYLDEQHSELEKSAQSKAAKFSADFLFRLANENLDKMLIEAALEDLQGFGLDEKGVIQDSAEKFGKMTVVSAHKISEQVMESISTAFLKLVDYDLKINYEVNKDLIAGVLFEIGSYHIKANIRDELGLYFAIER